MAYFVNSDNCDKATSSVWYLTITIKICVACWSETPIPSQMMLVCWFIKCYLEHQSHTLVYHWKYFKKIMSRFVCFRLHNFLFGKKSCMLNLTIFSSCSALNLIVCTLDLDKIVDHILFNNRTYILLFSCAHVKNVIGWQVACFQLSRYSSDFV